MSLYKSSYDSEEDLQNQQLYEGDEDETYVDEIKNFPRRCTYNDRTMVTNSKISLRTIDEQETFNSNVIIFIRVNKNNTRTIDCFLYSELKLILNNSSPVFVWEGGNLGRPLEDFPVYLLPIKDPADQEIWFEGNYGLLSRYSAFLLYEPKQIKIGSSFSESARHASLEYVWKVRPIMKIKYLREEIISENNSVFTNRLDFAPGNYPGYDTIVNLVDSIDVQNYVCIESQNNLHCPVVNMFYRNGDSCISFANDAYLDNYIVKTNVSYDKTYFEDGSYLYSGERKIYINEYNDEIICNGSQLTSEKLPDDKSIVIRYTVNDQLIWKETIKSDGIIEGIDEEKNNDESDSDDVKESQLMDIEFSSNEIDIFFDDKVPDDKLTIINEDNMNDPISDKLSRTTILAYNIPYFEGFELPDPSKVPKLKKLVLYIKPHSGNTLYSDKTIIIPMYPYMEYLSVYTSNKFDGLVKFTPPEIYEVEYASLKIVSLVNVKLDLANTGLPVGLNIERLFLKRLRSNLHEDSLSTIFDDNLIFEGDEDPSTLYGRYPNLKFLSMDMEIDLPTFPHLCVLFWTGSDETEISHFNPNVKIMTGDPYRFKSFNVDVCNESDGDESDESESDERDGDERHGDERDGDESEGDERDGDESEGDESDGDESDGDERD